MKTTRRPEEGEGKSFSCTYSDHPSDGQKIAKISEWENGEGYDIWLGDDKIELSHNEITVMQLLVAQMELF